MNIVKDKFYRGFAITHVMLLCAPQSVFAARPTLFESTAPTGGDGGTDLLTTLGRYAQDGFFMVGATITVVALLGTGYFTWDKVSEARDIRNATEWKDVAVTGIAGSVVTVFAGVLTALGLEPLNTV